MMTINLDEHLARDIGRVILNKLRVSTSDSVRLTIADSNSVLITIIRGDHSNDPSIVRKNISVSDIRSTSEILDKPISEVGDIE